MPGSVSPVGTCTARNPSGEISLANHAKVALVFAQTDPERAHRGLACFLVDADQPGFQPQPIHHKMGLRGSDTAAISLEFSSCTVESASVSRKSDGNVAIIFSSNDFICFCASN